MEVFRYTPEDFPEVLDWYHARFKRIPPEWGFSSSGYVVPGLVAGFMYKTNSGIVFLDTFISNPDSKREDRHRAIELIIDSATIEAQGQGFKVMACNVRHDSLKPVVQGKDFHDSGTSTGYYKEI